MSLTDLSPLKGKVANEGANEQGILTSENWNLLVEATEELQGVTIVDVTSSVTPNSSSVVVTLSLKTGTGMEGQCQFTIPAADENNSGVFSAEQIKSLASVITALQSAIDAEASARASADTAMDSRMTAAESKIAENAANIDSDAAQFQAKVDDLDRKIDGVIDTIELGGLDNLVTPDNAAAVAKKLTNARWTVTYDGRKVGVLEMFSDGSSHQITQMITSNYNMTVGSGSTTEHYDNEVRCYYRNYNINSPSLENKKGTWSSWAEVVPKYTRNWIESFKEYMERTVALTQAEYDALVEAGTVDEETYYNILEDE